MGGRRHEFGAAGWSSSGVPGSCRRSSSGISLFTVCAHAAVAAACATTPPRHPSVVRQGAARHRIARRVQGCGRRTRTRRSLASARPRRLMVSALLRRRRRRARGASNNRRSVRGRRPTGTFSEKCRKVSRASGPSSTRSSHESPPDAPAMWCVRPWMLRAARVCACSVGFASELWMLSPRCARGCGCLYILLLQRSSGPQTEPAARRRSPSPRI
jgi:hypothetical protein